MTLATVDGAGQPAARTVLLKGIDRRGLTFYTNLDSRKARELIGQRQGGAAVLVAAARAPGALRRDDRAGRRCGGRCLLRGAAARQPDRRLGVGAEQRDRRPRGARGRRAEDRGALCGDPVPRPPFWGGYRLVPERVEFWQGRINRLHDRLRYTRRGEGWQIDRLAP